MTPIVTHDVSRTFGTLTAVDQVSLDVQAGEVVGLLGANGAGKTTLVRMILGLLAPTSGQIRLFGGPQRRELRRRVGYVPQGLGLYRDLTPTENLDFRAHAFHSKPLHEPTTRSNGLVAALSLGEQRQLAFAAATQHGPDLLVLDEPTSGVSPLARADLWKQIRQHADTGNAVLVSTHHMDEAEQADRLVVMTNGHVVATGTASDIVHNRQAVEVLTDQWAHAFDTLDRDGRLISMAGRTIRILDENPATIRTELADAHITANTHEVPATLDEVMVQLSA